MGKGGMHRFVEHFTDLGLGQGVRGKAILGSERSVEFMKFKGLHYKKNDLIYEVVEGTHEWLLLIAQLHIVKLDLEDIFETLSIDKVVGLEYPDSQSSARRY